MNVGRTCSAFAATSMVKPGSVAVKILRFSLSYPKCVIFELPTTMPRPTAKSTEHTCWMPFLLGVAYSIARANCMAVYTP